VVGKLAAALTSTPQPRARRTWVEEQEQYDARAGGFRGCVVYAGLVAVLRTSKTGKVLVGCRRPSLYERQLGEVSR
jgi:hypothetical protein